MRFVLPQIDEGTKTKFDQIEKDFYEKDPIVALKRYENEFSDGNETV